MRAMIRAMSLAGAVLVVTSLGLTQGTQTPTVTVLVDKQQYQVASSADTVGQVLIDLGITLGDLDRTTPALNSRLAEGMAIRVTRITCRRVTEESVLEARTVLLPVRGRSAGYTRTLLEGRNGRLRRVVEVWEKDGELAQRRVIKEKVVVRPSDRVVMRSELGLASRGGKYRAPVRMHATAYEPGPRSCGAHADGRTANGMRAKRGVAAVDTRVIPFGTRMYIPGYGFAVAADRGTAIKGNRIDLCFDTYREAIRFGRRWVDVYFLPR